MSKLMSQIVFGLTIAGLISLFVAPGLTAMLFSFPAGVAARIAYNNLKG